jgi:hypothetical protein
MADAWHDAEVEQAPRAAHPPGQPLRLRDKHVKLGGEDDSRRQGGQQAVGSLSGEKQGLVPLGLQVLKAV